MLENIKTMLAEELNVSSFKCLLLGESSAYLEGVKSLKEFSREKISLTVKGGELSVLGENLKIKSFCGGDVLVEGKITSIERVRL